MDDLQRINNYDSILDVLFYQNFNTEYKIKVEVTLTKLEAE